MAKKRIFLDCGRFDGVAIEQYCVDDSWDIYSFDIDPQPGLEHLPPHRLIKKAVWIKDEELEVSLDPRKQASHIKDIAGTDYPETKKVQGIDFSWFVHELPDTTIVCSMDIEGCEFPALRKMVKDGTIQMINVLDIEFHQRIMPDEDDESARRLIREISDLGVIVRLKIVLGK